MKTLFELIKYAKPFRVSFILSVLSALAGISLSLAVPVLIGRGVDCAAGRDSVDFVSLKRVCIELVCVILLSAFFQWLMSYCSNKLSYKTVKLLRNEVFAKLNRLSLGYIDSKSPGDIINSVTTDIDVVAMGLLQGFTQVLSGIVTILGTLIFMFLINPYIALAVVLLTPLSLFMASFIAKRAHKKYTQQAKLRGKLTGYACEMIDGAGVVKAFGRENETQKQYEEMNLEWEKVGVMAHFYSAMTNPMTRFVNALIYGLVAVFGGVLVIGGTITVGALASFLAYCSQYTKPFNEISAVIAEFQNAISSAQRVFNLLSEPEEESDEALPELENVRGEVKLQNVCFSYDKNDFIKDLSFTAMPGQTVALVGPTGCGKTTLINLLMRFYDSKGGVITLDGHDITSVTRNSLRGQFAMVLQDTWLFSGTIYENIAYGKPQADRSEVIAAAKRAYAHSFISRLPGGYDTIINESNDNLSQGQKQLICIARVMLMDPPILLLDEATSSIDTRTELKIQKAFAQLLEGRTSFIVAHRLSTIKNADTILVMQDGKIVERGTHTELLEHGGLYKKLYESQFAVY
ncbi:MAG: ABC transporter ATP-binding protein [Clostridia bacterium]|nr:ABC transporter ATP-binding protein [Clostridia bacterium]